MSESGNLLISDNIPGGWFVIKLRKLSNMLRINYKLL